MSFDMFSGKGKGRNNESAGNPLSQAPKDTMPQPFYPVEPPQEFDEPGKELGPDAQVWKTYVKEVDQVDGELVDGWNKSMDVILIFAALFSAISTAFVIESYKSLVPDSADASAQTLLVISQTLKAMANGSQVPGTQSSPENELEAPLFSASWSAICVNVLWFLSLSLSVAVSLISMLAKEWCLTFMSSRTGPPGAQARRRQQRWEGLLWWRMEDVLMVLPSLIHLSLLLFAIGLCIFLWDIHISVAIPVIFITTVAAGAYIACTVLPFLDDYCPYGTVISMMVKRFKDMHIQTTHNSNASTQDEVTARALHWMVTRCENPRSVDVALQSLAGATKSLPRNMFIQLDIWTLIKRRLGSGDPNGQVTSSNLSNAAYMRALQSVGVYRESLVGPEYGLRVEAQRLEALTLGLQSCIDSLCDKIKEDSSFTTAQLLRSCADIAIQLLSTRNIIPIRPGDQPESQSRGFWWGIVDPETLSLEITECLEEHLSGEIDLGPTTYTILCTCLAFAFCSHAKEDSPSAISKRIMKLVQAYVSHIVPLREAWLVAPYNSPAQVEANKLWAKQSSRGRELVFLLGMIPILHDIFESSWQPEDPSTPETTHSHLEKAVEFIWSHLITETYSDPDQFDRWAQCESGVLHLLGKGSHYNMDPDSCMRLISFMDGEVLGLDFVDRDRKLDDSTRTEFVDYLHQQLPIQANTNLARFSPHFLAALDHYLPDVLERISFKIRPQLYMSTVKTLCKAKTPQEKRVCYQLMSRLPFPLLSSQFVELLAANELVKALSIALNDDDFAIQTFATAQLWLLFTMSLQFSNRKSETLTSLEKELLKYPLLSGDLGEQGKVVEQLETQFGLLFTDTDQFYTRFYLYRVLKFMLQKQGKHMPKDAELYLERIPPHLRGLDSSGYLEGKAAT